MSENFLNNNFLIPVIGYDDIILERGVGSFVYDTDGNKYLDLNSGQFCTVLGHSNNIINDEIIKQINKLVHTSTGMISSPVVELSKKIYEISGDMNGYSILLSTGAEAVEFCIRYAKALKKRDGVICFDKGYHGLTLGAQSITFGGIYTHPRVSSVYSFKVPTEYDSQEILDSCIKDLRDLMEAHQSEIAAMICEPIVSVGGMIYPPKKFWQSVRDLCSEFDILLILDECQTGFGRIGKWFDFQNLDIVPDMIATAKGIGLGYPVSMAIFNEQLIPEKLELMPITHYSSHQNDPFAATIVLTAIKYIEDNNILSKVKENGIDFLNSMKDIFADCNYVINPRGRGLMLGLDLNIPHIKNYRNIYKILHANMLKEGVIIQATNGGQTLRFLPDYLMSKEQFDYALNTLRKVLMETDWKQYCEDEVCVK